MEIAKLSLPEMSLKAALENYSHIELTEDEFDNAILQAKVKKDLVIQEDERQKIIEQNRKNLLLTTSNFTYPQMMDYVKYRANVLHENKVFYKPFEIDDSNRQIVELLCMYFSRDQKFESFGNYSLNKGICLVGVPGVGKSWLMKLFNKNPRQCFYIRDCKDISLAYQDKEIGAQVIEDYSFPIKAAVNDKDVFYQTNIGVCFSDVGTEDLKSNFGNKANVIADILFNRYKNGVVGDLTHAETNLTSDQIEQFYGQRIRSRFAEMFNWIKIAGSDRRKR